jgi:iron complex outermembrane recepter protein
VSGFARLRLDEGQFHAYADIQARNVGMTFQPDERWVPEGTSIPGHHWFFLNPRVGFSLDMDDATMLFGSVGRTGREPTRFDLLGGTQINEANLDVVLDPHTIRAEYATDVEVGIRHRHQHGMISLNGFAMFFNDEIAPIGRYIDQQFVQLRKNVESSTRLGLEFEARQRLFIDELSLAMNATVMKANIASYDPDNLGTDTTYTNVNPVLTPAWQGTATLTYAPLTSLSFDLSLRFVGEQFLELTNDPSLVLPAFTVLNAAARWTFLDRHRIVLNVANLTDLVYATNGATSFYNNAAVPTLFIQAPRSFTLLLELSI